MQHHQERITGVRGCELFCQYWVPEGDARSLILLAHGAGEHGARYRGLAEVATGRGHVLAVLDHNGHGRSEGVPGYVQDFADYVQDFARFHTMLGARFPGLPCCLLGHSLGGLIAGHYLLRRQDNVCCAALSGPLVMIEPDPGRAQRALVRLLGALAPRLGILRLAPEGISRDADVVRDYAADPLVFHGRISARMLREMFAAMAQLQARADQITVPLLIQHGQSDSMTAPAGSYFLYRAAGSVDKTLHIYPGLYHEIFNEPEKDRVYTDLFDWLEARCAFPADEQLPVIGSG